jgi:hypothetical protein
MDSDGLILNGQKEMTRRIEELEKELAEERRKREEAEKKAKESWQKLQSFRKTEAWRRDWEKNWKYASGPLKGVPPPTDKQEGGRV